MTGSGDTNKLRKKYTKKGFIITMTGKTHLKFTHKDMHGPVFTACSPSDFRAIKNFEAEIRRRMRPITDVKRD